MSSRFPPSARSMVNVSHLRAFTVVSLLAALAACADQPTEPSAGPGPGPKPAPVPLGLFEISLTGLDGSAEGGVAASRAIPVPMGGPDLAMNPVNTGIAIELLSSSVLLEG